MEFLKYLIWIFVVSTCHQNVFGAEKPRALRQKKMTKSDTVIPPQPKRNGADSVHDQKMSAYMTPTQGSTFIFEINVREQQCFHEDFDGSHNFILEYKVLRGGKRDIDVFVIGPGGEDIYSARRKNEDAIIFPTTRARNFSFCFSNAFSTISKKKVFFSLQAEDHATLSARLGVRKPTVLTAVEALQEDIYEYLLEVIESQKEYRLREAVDSNFAQDLSGKVGWLAGCCTIAMVVTGIGQTVILKYFFTQYGSNPQKI